MKSKASIILFAISFLVAILGEAYLLNVSQPHTFSIVGIGLVVILTGYLLFDSIWEYISSNNNKNKNLWGEVHRRDKEQWDIKYTELLNIQKATYAALKKSEVKLRADIKELSDKLDLIIHLQNIAMDGQRKAPNLPVNQRKETVEAIKEESTIDDIKVESEIIPLYDDPNAALSSDEIAELFNTYGK